MLAVGVMVHHDKGVRAFGTVVLALLVAACGDDIAGGDGDARPASDARRLVDAGPGNGTVRFVVLGDTGEGNMDQRLVAIAIRNKCALEGCDFAILLGDNIYDDGVSSVDDPQWMTKFEDPYIDVELLFYAVLGNHDYGGQVALVDTPGVGNEWDKGPLEVMYSDRSAKWTMPATYYTFTRENVGFIMLDTNSILWDDTTNGDQRDWYPMALSEVAGADWVFAAGHHPVRSNGAHGNAGNYESIEVAGTEIPIPIPILDGSNVEDFFDEVVCGTVDIYFAGHDHNRQWLDEPGELCGAELIVNGAGAKVKDFEDRGNANHWQDATTEGFLYVVVDGNTLTGQFIDKNGTMNFERTITR